MTRRVVVVSTHDDAEDPIHAVLEAEGFEVLVATGTADLTAALHTGEVEVVVVHTSTASAAERADVVAFVRSLGSTAIAVLVPQDDEDLIVALFEAGADQVMVGSGRAREVVARLRAASRRTSRRSREAPGKRLRGEGVEFDVESRTVHVDGRSTTLARRESLLLEALLRNAGRVVTRDALAKLVLPTPYPKGAKALDQHIRRLRRDVEAVPSAPTRLRTIRGVGYTFAPAADDAEGGERTATD